MSTLIDDIKTSEEALDKARTESLISPRFYSTDYEAMDRIDVLEQGGGMAKTKLGEITDILKVMTRDIETVATQAGQVVD
ncbi:MAG: hypothetical protein EB114_13195, partial [Betaproteobacteria bacterium]|nr:hypothetical protein [Betaproteobacteria bacterium]